MQVLCKERCFDSQKVHGYLENEVYDLSQEELDWLEKINLIKYFKPLTPPEPVKKSKKKEAEEPAGDEE